MHGGMIGAGLGLFVYVGGSTLNLAILLASEFYHHLTQTPTIKPTKGFPFIKTVGKFGLGGALACGGLGAMTGAYKGMRMFEKKHHYLKIKAEDESKENISIKKI